MFARMLPVAVLTAVFLARPAVSLASKPADLPLDLSGKCINQAQEQPPATCSPQGEKPACEDCDHMTRCCPYLDALSPLFVSMLDELRAALQTEQGDAACDPHWLAEVRHLYLIAQQCKKTGDVDMAKNCLRQIGLICPESSYARRAEQELPQLNAAPRRLSADVIVLVRRTCPGPLVVEVEGEAVQSPAEWWLARLLKAAQEIREYRLQRQNAGAGGAEEQEHPPTPPSAEEQHINQLLRSTVPIETHLDEPQEPTTPNPLRWLTRTLDIDVDANSIRAAVSFGGRLYRIALEW